MSRGIAGNHLPRANTVVWLTPPHILSALGTFDLDPCAVTPPRPWRTARKHIALPKNGLKRPWQGRVWLNPPYGQATTKWMRKMARHGCGIALIFARVETACWMRWVWPYAHAVLFLDKRLCFCYPSGQACPNNSGAPSALIAYSAKDARILRSCGLAGVVVSGAEMVGR